MDCCQCEGIESKFSQKIAAKELEQYRNKGPSKNTRMLIEAIKEVDISGLTLLDIGGGVGVIQFELLNAGVSNCFNVEASKAYVKATVQEANRQGYADRINHIHGNFVDLAVNIQQCDIVTLDRVICCYHDVWELVGKSCAKAMRLYAVVYPLDTLKSKFYTALENLYYRITRSSFRTYIHPTATVEEIVQTNGFERRFYRESGMWQIVVYERTNPYRDPI